MAGEPTITVVGNLTADPELRFTPSGAAVASFTVASTPRTFDRQANEFKDGETLFMRCSVWRDQAEHVAQSLGRGMRVVVTGLLVSRSWTTQEGENRTAMELQAEEVAPSLRFATATVTRSAGGTGQRPPQQSGQAPQQGGGQQGSPAGPPQQGGGWGPPAAAGGPPQQGGGWGGAPTYDQPPF